MNIDKETIIRSADKKGTKTSNSEYVFHFSSCPAHRNVSLYGCHFKSTDQHKNLHYHKIMSEIFTVLHGEFFFYTKDKEYILCPNDTIIIPQLVAHGFNAKLPDSRVQFVFTDITDRERFFQGLVKITNDEMNLNEIELEAFYNKYDQYSVS